ncbi:MAG: tRNA 2-thiouridine(34) synthase MnmA [bacterium]
MTARLRAFLDAGLPNHFPPVDAGPVVVGMSGGVDSSVAAWILRELGYEVIGITAHLFGGFGDTRSHQGCCSLPGSEDARRVAAHLDIPFYVLNLTNDFKANVLDYFASSYLAGETPNPCVECNRGVKFDVLLRRAEQLGAAWLATGHYARIVDDGLVRQLAVAADDTKDQSYFLYFLDQLLLLRLGFPLGNLTKLQVREIATEAGLPVADKAESQDLCFAPDRNYAAVVEHLRPGESRPGPILTATGECLGEHQGLIHYTVGQRKGMGIAAEAPLFVLRKEPASNALIVGFAEDLPVSRVWVRDFVRTDGGDDTQPFQCEFRPRYRGPRVAADCTPHAGGRLQVDYHTPHEIPAPGQVAVCYVDDRIVGGGIVDHPWRAAKTMDPPRRRRRPSLSPQTPKRRVAENPWIPASPSL